ncbi:MAG: efflux RND transporter periplasmic adaptor subunit [Candidatus Omnitrophica bacterium]|jgi:membrane fusion protein (multidrug efflux system)|nr:efflux RND transporter periplasmic adaptor subunit [Candidatus Omnitrophota bacterium]
MKFNLHKNKSAIFKALLLLAVILVAFSVLSKHITFVKGLPTFKKKTVVQKKTVDDIAIPVKGYKVTRVDFSDTLPALGTVKGYREVELKFAETGYIEYINFRDGEKAVEGDIIASLDQREKLLKLEYAKNEMERTQKLFDLGAIADAKLQQTKLEYQSARLEYEKTNLVAPFDGYLGSVEKQKGDFVTPNDRFGSFVNLTDAYAEFGAIEKDISKIKIGLPVTMTVDSFPQDTFSGEIESISPIVEGKTRTFKVKARVVNEGEKLKAGMFGRVGVQIYQKEHTLVIPSAAFRKKEQEYFVYVIHPEEAPAETAPAEKDGKDGMPPAPKGSDIIIGTVEIRPIQVAYATPDAVEIKAGLEDEELIIADIQQEMEEKAKVEVTEIQEYTF